MQRVLQLCPEWPRWQTASSVLTCGQSLPLVPKGGEEKWSPLTISETWEMGLALLILKVWVWGQKDLQSCITFSFFCIALGDSPTAFHRKCQPGTLSWGQNAYWSQRLFQHIETSEHQVRNSLFGWYFGWFDWLLCGLPGKKRTDASLTSPSSVKLDKSLCPFMCMSENLRKQHCLLKSKQILNS